MLSYIKEVVNLSANEGFKNPRWLINSHLTSNGEKEHQHSWIIFDSEEDKITFDQKFGTVNGVPRQHQVTGCLSLKPYDTDISYVQDLKRGIFYPEQGNFYIYGYTSNNVLTGVTVATPPL